MVNDSIKIETSEHRIKRWGQKIYSVPVTYDEYYCKRCNKFLGTTRSTTINGEKTTKGRETIRKCKCG